MLYLLIFLSSLIFTLFFTPYLIIYLYKIKIMDVPGGRKIHAEAVPRMGGILLSIPAVAALVTYYGNLNEARWLIPGSLIIAACGIFDDIIGLRWRTKFLFQGAAAFLLLLFIIPQTESIILFGINFPGFAGYLLYIIFIIGAINSINLLDGLDGLVGSFSLLVLLFLIVLGLTDNNILVLILACALAGSTLGFLKFNAYPAKIFLGDTGSLTLGFFLVVLTSLTAIDISGTLDLTFPVIILGVPILDTLKVMFLRIINKKSPFTPDRNHIHHILYGSAIRHKVTVFIIGFFTAIFALTAIFYFKYSKEAGGVFFVFMALFVFTLQLILGKIKSVPLLKNSVKKIIHFPRKIINIYKKALIPGLYILIFIFIVSILPYKNIAQSGPLIFTAAALLILFFISSNNFKKTKLHNDFYVYINITFAILLSYTISGGNTSAISLLRNTGIISTAGLFVFVVVFLYVREDIYERKAAFLTGLDLILGIIISTYFLLDIMLVSPEYQYIANGFIQGYIMYLAYRIIVYVKGEFVRLYYSSFALAAIVILLMIFHSNI